MRRRPSCLLQSAGGEANRILLASALSSMRIICQNRVSRHDWIIAVSLGCFVSLRTSSFRTNWYHLMLAAYADTTGRVHRSVTQDFKLYALHPACIGDMAVAVVARTRRSR